MATQEELQVTTDQLSAYVTEQAYRMGVAPDRLAKQLSDNNQLGAVAADVLRANALTLLAERARVVDEDGRPVYLSTEEEAVTDDGEAESADEESADEGPADEAPADEG